MVYVKLAKQGFTFQELFVLHALLIVILVIQRLLVVFAKIVTLKIKVEGVLLARQLAQNVSKMFALHAHRDIH